MIAELESPKVTTPGPGIYEFIEFETYLAWDAVSNTRLSQLAKSPAHYKANLELEQNRSLTIGSLSHCGKFEPAALPERYAVMPAFELDDENCTGKGERSNSKSTLYYKSKVAQFELDNRHKQIVAHEWYAEAEAVVGALCKDELARECLDCEGPVELAIVWDDDETGIRCKARLDKIATKLNRLVDLKTTADLEKFVAAIGRYGYHRQLAHYSSAWTAHTGEELEPWIVAVENKPIYTVHAAPLDDVAIIEGFSERRRLMRLLADCLDTDHWPGPPRPNRWMLPEWAIRPVTITLNGEEGEI